MQRPILSGTTTESLPQAADRGTHPPVNGSIHSKWKLAAIMVFLSLLCDGPWLLEDPVWILGTRVIMAAACVLTGLVMSHCRKRSQQEWVLGACIACIVGGFAVLSDRQGITFSYTLAVFELLAFIMLFVPVRRATFVSFASAIGFFWFLYVASTDVQHRELLWQIWAYCLYVGMLMAGLVWYNRIRATDQERKINLVQRARHLEARTRELIEENERKLEMLVTLSPDPTILHDGETIHFANEAFMHLANVTSLEVIHGVSLHLFTHPDDKERAADYYVASSQEAALKFHQYTFVKWGGESIDVEACSIALNHQPLERRLTQTVLRDLTALKLVEERLGRSDRMSALGQMAAGFAHEIRNPLTSLKGFIQLLRRQAPDHTKYYDIMTLELDRIHSIVNDFMMISKPKPISFREESLESLLTHVSSLLESSAYCYQIRLVTEFDSNLPAIMADGDQLKQVFINLVKNAFEAMPEGGRVLIRTKRKEGTALVQIVDEGIGIPEDKLPKLGEPFYTTKENGTGLGLHVCYRIVESHKGRMSIRSTIGQGTTVEIALPLLL